MAVIKQFSGGKILLAAPKASGVFYDNIIHSHIHTERHARAHNADAPTLTGSRRCV